MTADPSLMRKRQGMVFTIISMVRTLRESLRPLYIVANTASLALLYLARTKPNTALKKAFSVTAFFRQ